MFCDRKIINSSLNVAIVYVCAARSATDLFLSFIFNFDVTKFYSHAMQSVI